MKINQNSLNIRRSGCGICVAPGDVKEFSQAVLRLHRDESFRKEMGEKARKYAEQYFSRAVCTKRYEEVLFSSLDQDH